MAPSARGLPQSCSGAKIARTTAPRNPTIRMERRIESALEPGRLISYSVHFEFVSELEAVGMQIARLVQRNRLAKATFSRNEIKRKRGESRGKEKKAEPKDAGVLRRAKAPSPLARPNADGSRVGYAQCTEKRANAYFQRPGVTSGQPIPTFNCDWPRRSYAIEYGLDFRVDMDSLPINLIPSCVIMTVISA
jgi:hypothetical protein